MTSSMQGRDRALCAVYGVIAVGALVATWSQNIRFFLREDGGGLVGFLEGTYANPAAASITNDIVFVLFAAFVLMYVEARRLGIRWLWVYFLMSFTVAISVAFPLFLIARQRAVARGRGAAEVVPE